MTSHKELGDWVLEDAHSAGLGEQQSLASEDDNIRVGRSTPNPVVSPNLNAPRSPKEEAGIEQDLESAGTGMGVALARLMQCLIEDWQLIEEEPIPAGGSKRVFALMKQKTSKQKAHAAAMFSNPTRDRYDYEQKYPQVAYNEAVSPNARVWRVFLDEAGPFDLDTVENIRDTLDVILVFAGLFSVIVSTLVSQASTALQPDYGRMTSALLMELVEVHRALATGTNTIDVARSTLTLASPSSTSSPDRWVSGMWFVSLTVSLSTALLSVLVKQWIQAFVSPVSGPPLTQARIRHFRYMGVEKWHVPLIVGLLPTLLHLALFLFFIGLVVLLSTLDNVVAVFVGLIAILAYTAYIAANLLPVWYPECPYKTPISTYAYLVVRNLSPRVRKWQQHIRVSLVPLIYGALVLRYIAASTFRNTRIILEQLVVAACHYKRVTRDACAIIMKKTGALARRIVSSVFQTRPDLHGGEEGSVSDATGDFVYVSGTNVNRVATKLINVESTAPTLQKSEAAAVHQLGDELNAHMFSWLCNISANPSVRTVVTAAVVDLRVEYLKQIISAGVLEHVCAGLKECTAPVPGGITRKLRCGRGEKLLSFACAHMRLFPWAVYGDRRNGRFLGCRCDWTLDHNSLEGSQAKWAWILLGLQPPVARARFVPVFKGVHISHLNELQPPITPQSLWILLLSVAIAYERTWDDVYEDSWSAFSSLWTLNHREMVFPDDQQWSNKSTPADAFSLLQGILLSAFLCHWSSKRWIETSPKRRGYVSQVTGTGISGTRLQDPDLFRRAMQPRRAENLGKALLYEPQEIGQQYQSLRFYYDLKTAVHILDHLITTSPTGMSPLLHAVERLYPIRRSLFPFPQLGTYHESGGGRLKIQHENYSLFDMLVPTPTSMSNLVTRASQSAGTPTAFDSLDISLSLCESILLLQINQKQDVSFFKDKNLLQALEDIPQYLLSLPGEAAKHDTEPAVLVDNIVITYLEWASSRPDYADHLDYVFGHLAVPCACSLISRRQRNFKLPLTASLLHCIRQRPSNPSWKEAVRCVQFEMEEMQVYRNFEGRNLVEGFCAALRIELQQAERQCSERHRAER